jgi:site-specific recombinase XerD
MSERTLAAVLSKSKATDAHAHRFRHPLATDILARGGTMSDVADVLSISRNVARKHYAKWSPARQERISGIMRRVFTGPTEETKRAAAVQ